MKVKIDFERMADDPLHWLRIGLYIAIFAAVAIPLESALMSLPGPEGSGQGLLSFGYPAILAGGIRVAEGISRFRGEVHPTVWSARYTQLLVTLIVSIVLLPALFLWGVRARSQWRLHPGGRGVLIRITLALTVGGFAVVSLLSSVPFSVAAWEFEKRLRDDDAKSRGADRLVSELSLMATRARIRYFLQREKSGGAEGWMTTDGLRTPRITLQDLRLPLPEKIPGSATSPGPEDFFLEIVDPDSLVIWGVGAEPNLMKDTIHNKNGQQGKIQAHIGVVPDHARLISAFD